MTPSIPRRTADPDEAQDIVRQVYVPHRLASPRTGRLAFELESHASGSVTLGRLRYGADVELTVPPMASAYHVNLPVRGRFTARQPAEEVAGGVRARAVVFDPDLPHVAAWAADAVVFALKVDRRALLTHAGGLLGADPPAAIRFPLGFELTSPAGQSLLAAVRFLWQELRRDGGVASSPILRAQLEGFLLTQLLTGIPNDVREVLVRPARRPGRDHVARVVDHVQAHPEQALSLADLARIGAVGARALQEGFRAEFGMSPTAYLRSVRLERVHADLLAAPAGATVTAVATRWGFAHLSRFAEQYRRRFGQAPSATLHRAVTTQ
ncbi:AraC family transcriptional regulator [Nakamurella leprariae]|uniref:AraC family transcriptional regulator n=1 Tax=Nakamurella leprariae TaxID=2803911 RepID=A0A939BVI4_9ACTN|nr:AraC family transcriptional regulator [Nakamurella leprariae]MBM9466553.1 AraC family transcriptional regulator [Nakamurella leprariae]